MNIGHMANCRIEYDDLFGAAFSARALKHSDTRRLYTAVDTHTTPEFQQHWERPMSLVHLLYTADIGQVWGRVPCVKKSRGRV